MSGGIPAVAEVKISVTRSEALVREVRQLAPNVSGLVGPCVTGYVRRWLRGRALEASRGGWGNDAHGKLDTATDVSGVVRELRAGWNRSRD